MIWMVKIYRNGNGVRNVSFNNEDMDSVIDGIKKTICLPIRKYTNETRSSL